MPRKKKAARQAVVASPAVAAARTAAQSAAAASRAAAPKATAPQTPTMADEDDGTAVLPPGLRKAPLEMNLEELRAEVTQRRRDDDRVQYFVDLARASAAKEGLTLGHTLLTKLARRYAIMVIGYEAQALLFVNHDFRPNAPFAGLELNGITRVGGGEVTPAALACDALQQVIKDWTPTRSSEEVRKALIQARTLIGDAAIAGVVALIKKYAAKKADQDSGLLFDSVHVAVQGKFWVLPCVWLDSQGARHPLRLVLVVPQNEEGGTACARLKDAASLWTGNAHAILVALCVARRRSENRPAEAGGGNNSAEY